MTTIENLSKNEGVEKLKKMVDDIKFCFFTTNSNNFDHKTATIMTAQAVDNDGSIWFFSRADSDRNKDIANHKNIQLYFSSPEKNSYVSVDCEAEIIFDKKKIMQLWDPLLKSWFKDGVDDNNISLIKAKTKNANYWDIEGGKMINFFKMISSTITGNNFIESKQGNIKI